MRRLAVVFGIGALLAGCKLGYDPSRHPSARSPHGTEVVITSRRSTAPAIVRGELLAVTDSGVVLEVQRARTDSAGAAAMSSRLVLAPYTLRFVFQYTGASGKKSVRGPTTRAKFETATPVARYPFGLPPHQLEQLLALRQQDRLYVVTSEGEIR